VGDLVARLDLSQPGVSKHLKVLRGAALVGVRTDGKRRMYALRSRPLADVNAWLEPYRAFWTPAPGETFEGEGRADASPHSSRRT
jgi:DNA-binding transcriptional ArsR family regulator